MQEDNKKYTAFISYRHAELDKKWAIWLANSLETYSVPKELVKTGSPRRLGKIYRDEDEFSASPNLDDHVKDALKASSHLIVICSPSTLGSKWIDKKIQYFRSLGRGDKILLLLIEGEPLEAFPDALWIDKKNNIVSPGHEQVIEPIAADVRKKKA